MRYALLALLFLAFLTGCATDDADRAFYNTGWIRPEAGANARMNAR